MAKRYPPKMKFQVVVELLQGEQTGGQLSKSYGIHTKSIKKLKEQFLEKGPEVFAQNTTIAKYERWIAQLERLLGRKEVEIARTV